MYLLLTWKYLYPATTCIEVSDSDGNHVLGRLSGVACRAHWLFIPQDYTNANLRCRLRVNTASVTSAAPSAPALTPTLAPALTPVPAPPPALAPAPTPALTLAPGPAPLSGRASPEELRAFWHGQPGNHILAFSTTKKTGSHATPMDAVRCIQVISEFVQSYPVIPAGYVGYGRSIGVKELFMVAASLGDEAASHYVAICDAYTQHHSNTAFRHLTSVYRGELVKDLKYAWNDPSSELKIHTFVEVAKYAKHVMKYQAEPAGAM